MNNNDGGTMYDFVDETHEAPAQPKRERVVGQFANRENMSDPYVNKEQPKHVKEAMRIEQPDNSYYAFGDYVWHRHPKSEFDRSVNIAFGAYDASLSYIEQRNRYQSLYREMMAKL